MNIQNLQENTPLVYVSFSAEIIPNTIESLIAVMSECANKNVQKVNLLLSTPGGNVNNGLNLYNVLCSMPFELTTHNVGNVDSIGNAVFLAGKKRYATYNASFMFHGVGFNPPPQMRFEEKNLREHLDGLLNDQDRIGKIIAKHTNIAALEIEKLFREAQTKDVQFAIDKGIIDDVRDVQIPAGSPIISLVFKR